VPSNPTSWRDRWQRLPLVFYMVCSRVYRASILPPACLVLQLTWPELMWRLIITLLPLVIGLVHITRVKELFATLQRIITVLVEIKVDYFISDIRRLLNDFLDSVFLIFNLIIDIFSPFAPGLAQVPILGLLWTCERHVLLVFRGTSILTFLHLWALELHLQRWP
jgi:hypothetical protein